MHVTLKACISWYFASPFFPQNMFCFTCLFIDCYRIIGIIIKEIEANIAKNTFLANFRMSALPVLCKKFVELVSALVIQCLLLLLNCNTVWEMQCCFVQSLEHVICHVLKYSKIILLTSTERKGCLQIWQCSIAASRHVRSNNKRYDGQWNQVTLFVLNKTDFLSHGKLVSNLLYYDSFTES